MRAGTLRRSLSLIVFLLVPIQALAATRTWDGGGADTKWGTAANWSDNTVPGAGDNALFDGTSVKDATIPIATTVGGIEIRSPYTGAVSQSGGSLLTVGTGSFVQGGGTFRAGSGSLRVNTNFTQSGGIFIAPKVNLKVTGDFSRTGGTFTAQHGTLFLTPRNAEILTPGGTTFNNVNLNDGLMGYWKFNDLAGTTAVDSSGHRNNGTFVGFGNDGDSYWRSDVPSEIQFSDAGSLHFSGCYASGQCPSISDPGSPPPYVDIGTDASINPTTITLAAWVRPNASGNGYYRYVFGEGRDIGGYGFHFAVNTGNTLSCFFGTPDGITTNTPTASTLALDTWSHIACTFDGSAVKIYINGSLHQTISLASPSSIRYDGESAKIGLMGQIFFGYYHYPFRGFIDEARIYDRALTAAEISRLANGRQPQTSSGSVTLAGNLNLSGSLLLNAGTFEVSASSYAITASGSWLNSGGIFTPRSGTVTFNGPNSSLLSGGGSFNTLTLSRSTTVTLADAATVSTLVSIGAGSTLALPFYDLTATAATITNAGTITETNGGAILHPTSLSVSPSSLTIGDSIIFTLSDSDENIDGTAIDTVVTAVNREYLTLTETGVASGIFTGTMGTIHGSQYGSSDIIQNDTLCSFPATLNYVDGQDNTDTASASATVNDPHVTICSTPSGGGRGGGGGVPRGTTSFVSAPLSMPNTSSADPVSASHFIFSDVPSSAWYAKYIYKLAGQDIVSGYKNLHGAPTGEFGPSNPVTYAEILKMAIIAAGKTVAEGSPQNTSARQHWSFGYVKQAENMGISLVTRDLNVHAPATRGQVVQTVFEVFGLQTGTPPEHPFTDLLQTHPHHKAIALLYQLGIITGDTNSVGTRLGTVRPDAPVNRAEAAKIIALMLEYMNR